LLLARVLGLKDSLWTVLADRLLHIWEKSGTPFVISYMKECRLALIAWVNRSPYIFNPKVRVRLTPSGLPRVIPKGLRPTLMSNSAQCITLIRGLHTVFNLYRVIDWRGAVPDFSTITNSFSGVSETLFPQEVRAVIAMFPQVTPTLTWVWP